MAVWMDGRTIGECKVLLRIAWSNQAEFIFTIVLPLFLFLPKVNIPPGKAITAKLIKKQI